MFVAGNRSHAISLFVSANVLPREGGGVLSYVTLTETCGPIGMVFRVFCLERGVYFIDFCLKQGISAWPNGLNSHSMMSEVDCDCQCIKLHYETSVFLFHSSLKQGMILS